MNGAEQRERFTAVSRAEKRLEAVELVTEGLGRVIVDDRALVMDQFRDVLALCHTTSEQLVGTQGDVMRYHQACDARWADTEALIRAAVGREQIARVDFQRMTLWQRLRWLVRGAV